MKKYICVKIFVFYLLLLSGCLPSRNGVGVGIDIFDTKTAKHRFIPSAGFREVVIIINEDKKVFYTLEREGNKFKCRTRNYEGTELKHSFIPLFSDGYCGDRSYTVTPDGQKFVYLKERTKNLYLYDVKTGEESLILENIIESMVNMCELKFISDKDFILALSNSANGSITAIYRTNITSKDKTLICSPFSLRLGRFCFNRDKKYFAFWDAKEEYSIYGNYDIYDLANSKLLSTILGDNKLFNGMGLSPSGDKLVFAEGGMIKIYDTTAKKLSVLEIAITGSSVIGFMDEENILISNNENNYIIYNIKTKKDHRLGNIPKNGNIFIIQDEGLIVTETGF